MLELNKIYNMDCLEGLKRLDDESIDIVITSPPYNLHFTRGTMYPKERFGTKLEYGDYKDDLPDIRYIYWQKEVLKECWRVIKKAIFYNIKAVIKNGKYNNRYELFPFYPRQEIIWYTRMGLNFAGTFFVPKSEKIFLFAKNEFKIKKGFKELGDVWTFMPERDKKHPAPFPVELPNRCILSCTEEDDIILDPFAGSGTTLVVAKKLRRNFIGFELNLEYVKIAEKRLKNTGVSKSLLETKKSLLSLGE